MSKTRLYLVRHGESLGNCRHILLGHTDWDLSPLGYEQAEECAAALANIKFAAIYSSPLMRAYNTAIPNAKIRGADITVAPELIEQSIGEWEARPSEEVANNYKEIYDTVWKKHYSKFRAPGGESTEEVANRIYSALEAISKRHEGQNVLLCFHGAAIRAFFSKISGHDAETSDNFFFPSNASYTLVDYEGGRFTPVSYSVDSHVKSKTYFVVK